MAYCVIIQKPVADICVLPSGTCMWQDRLTNQCRYDPTTSPHLTIEQYCEAVHQVQPSEEALEEQKQLLIREVKK